jgi:putative ABC transport system permease protein
MIRHLLKMVWNRKRINGLIILEIFVSFLVLFGVVISGVYLSTNYRQPLGFDYSHIWDVEVHQQTSARDENKEAPAVTIRQMALAIQELEEVESVTGIEYAPYSQSSSNSSTRLNGLQIRYEHNRATDNFPAVLGLQMVSGRWFNNEDDAATDEPVVINQQLARELFGNENPLGKSLGDPPLPPKGEAPRDPNRRIIGVFTDFRQHGELAGLTNFLFFRQKQERAPHNLLIKVRPGTTAAFEEKLSRKLRAVNKDWSYVIEPLTNMRETSFRIYLAPLLAAGLVAAFLMIMVALGLTGVLWQNVTRRIREIGLRRAKGATANDIHTQILGELFVIATFGLLLGLAVIVQLPLLDFLSFLSAEVYLDSIAISLVLIYLLTLLCGLYPSRMATRVQPAEALHYE